MNKGTPHYHQKVASYYDTDADLGFESRAATNSLLERIRDDFRQITIAYPFESALEIGCGPGIDLEWFAKRFPEREFTGVDISGKMVQLAEKRIHSAGLKNAVAIKADERNLLDRFKPGQLDMVFVYFGALNTVESLPYAAEQIHSLLKPGGTAVLTFVNKWYLREMLVQTLKLKPKIAFARLKKEWGGYSLDRHLPSRCYSPGEIKESFSDFTLLQKKGYSICFPAWYNHKKYQHQPQKLEKLWERDQKLQNGLLWSKGEYTLFVFRK